MDNGLRNFLCELKGERWDEIWKIEFLDSIHIFGPSKEKSNCSIFSVLTHTSKFRHDTKSRSFPMNGMCWLFLMSIRSFLSGLRSFLMDSNSFSQSQVGKYGYANWEIRGLPFVICVTEDSSSFVYSKLTSRYEISFFHN